MQMISGTVKNAVRLQALNNKWQQKKDSGKLTKDERIARENWTREDYLIQDIKEQAEQNRKQHRKEMMGSFHLLFSLLHVSKRLTQDARSSRSRRPTRWNRCQKA